MAENFPNFKKEIDFQVQEKESPSKMSPKRPYRDIS